MIPDCDTKSALIISSWRYEDNGLRRLIAPAKDAASLARVLEDPNIGGFQVTTILNQPSHRVRQRIQAFFTDRKRDDLLLLYFSGHGIKDQDGRLYFATRDTNKKLLQATSVESAFVADVMRQSYSRRQVLLLDCCYSGAFLRGARPKGHENIGAIERFSGRGRVVLTASDAMQYSFEGEDVSGVGIPSVFTRILVEGLETGNADLDDDGLISVDELYDYVHDRLTDQNPHQTPMKSAEVAGKIIIARNVVWAKKQEELQARKRLEDERIAAEQAETDRRRSAEAEQRRLAFASAEQRVEEGRSEVQRRDDKRAAKEGSSTFRLHVFLSIALWIGWSVIFYRLQPFLADYPWQSYTAYFGALLGLIWIAVKLEHLSKRRLLTIWAVAVILEVAIGIGGWNVMMHGTAKGHKLTGDSLFHNKDWNGAAAQYREAIRLKADYAQAYTKLGDALFNRQDWKGAIEAYRASTELEPNNTSAHSSLADALSNNGDWNGAISEYRRIITIRPNDVDANLGLANALNNKNDWDGAISQYRLALNYDPNNIDAHYDLARVLAKKQDWQSAIAEYRQILSMKPDYAAVRRDLAYALLAKNDWQGAINEYNEIIRLTPSDADAHYNLGVAQYRKQNYPKAADAFRHALELQPESSQARDALSNALKQQAAAHGEK